jgi:hypothetical protein
MTASPDMQVHSPSIGAVLLEKAILPSDKESWITPFTVATDWIAQTLPAMGELAECLNTITEKPESVDIIQRPNRAIKRKLTPELEDITPQVFGAAARLLVDLDPSINRAEAAITLFQPHVSKTQEGQKLSHFWAGYAVQFAHIYESLQFNAMTLTDEIAHLTEANSASQYDLLRLMVTIGEKEVINGDETDLLPEEIYALLLHYEEQSRGTHNLPRQLSERLEAGEFSPFIATDLLSFMARTDAELDNSRHKKLRSMWELTKFCAPEVPEAVLIDRMSQAIEYWPAECQNLIRTTQNLFEGLLQAQSNMASPLTDDLGFNEKLSVTHADFLASMEDLKTAFARNGQMLARPTKHQIVQANIARKRPSHMSNPEPVEQPQVESAQAVTPRSLYVLRTGGRGGIPAEDRAPKAVIEIVDEYIKKHKGVPSLESDVEAILDYVTRIDLSGGRVKGLRKYGASLMVGSERQDIYGFKPVDAVGLSTSSAIAKKIRVLMVFREDTVGIVALDDRDAVTKIERNLGFASGAAR